MVTVRRYQKADAPVLAAIHNRIYLARPQTVAWFRERMATTQQRNGRIWVICVQENVVGYGAVTPLPGLRGIVELEGFIAPQWQRQGLGSRLLQHLVAALAHTAVKQLSHAVTTLDSPAAHFLRHHHFFIQHQELNMVLAKARDVPPPSLPAESRLYTLPRQEAISRFCRLYGDAFDPYRWYQPYTEAEVAATLQTAGDILFLSLEERPIGFVWTRKVSPQSGEIEPIGVVKRYQERGYGRLLLQAGIRRLVERGAEQIVLSVWRENAAAVHLYRRFGFQQRQTRTYLAYNLHPT